MEYQILKNKVPTAYVATYLSLATFVQAHPIVFVGEFKWLNAFQLRIGKVKNQWIIIEPTTGVWCAQGKTFPRCIRAFESRIANNSIHIGEFQHAIRRKKTWMETHRFAIEDRLKMMRLIAS